VEEDVLPWSRPARAAGGICTGETAMRIIGLRLFNFRCFRELAITFHERMTVLVAPNAGGKSTVLDAVACLLSGYVREFDGSQWQEAAGEDIRVVKKEDGTRAPVSPSSLEGYMAIDGRSQAWYRVLKGGARRTPSGDYARGLLDVLHSEQPSAAVTLPVIAYYGAKRTVPSEQFRTGLDLGSAALMREQGYDGCLTGNANANVFRTWYGQAAIAELSVQQKLGKEPVGPSNRRLAERARAVKEAVNAVLAGASAKSPRYWLDLFLWMDSQVGVLDTEQNVELGLNQLSDGVQCMLSLAGDLAARCAVLNSHFGPDAPAKSPGMVLIDEVDMHLHPAWQQRVLGDLQRAFPRIQFIVTTHSPQVLTTVPREQVRVLTRDGTAAMPDDGTFGAESSRVLGEVVAVHSRPPDAQPVRDLQKYLSLVEDGKAGTREALRLREALEDSLGKHDPDLHMADVRASQLTVLGR